MGYLRELFLVKTVKGCVGFLLDVSMAGDCCFCVGEGDFLVGERYDGLFCRFDDNFFFRNASVFLSRRLIVACVILLVGLTDPL